MKRVTVQTRKQIEMIDITGTVNAVLREKKADSGFCVIFVPHTTAAVTINENADPDVPRDILAQLDTLVPLSNNYRHREGNSAAHIKSSLIGASEMLFVEGGRLVCGTWQSVFFCEFDGPRTRNVVIDFYPQPRDGGA